MKFMLEGMPVYFPYEFIYKEQYEYMLEIKRALDAKGHALLEMPTGTGKTICLLSIITSYQLSHPDIGKLVYCTRTVPEMEKVLAELRVLHEYRQKEMGMKEEMAFLAVGLSSRKNLCINEAVMEQGAGRESVDAQCRNLTASWVRAAAAEGDSVDLCDFYENYEARGSGAGALLPPGVYTMQDLRDYGHKKRFCPYFLARHMIAYSNVVVYNYSYLLDPKVASLVSRELERECIVVFDEAHNIDNVCIESLSVNVRQRTIDGAQRNLSRLHRALDQCKEKDAQKLREEYHRLVQGLQQHAPQAIRPADEWLSNPVLPENILREAVPGNIRRAEHFLAFLRRFLEYVKKRMQGQQVETESSLAFVQSAVEQGGVDVKSLRFCYERLQSLLMTLEITDMEEFNHIRIIADFATIVGTYKQGFAVVFEPYDERMPGVADPVLQLCCLDASLAIKPTFDNFQSVVITSGTLSPIDQYAKLLGFHPKCTRSLSMSLTRDCICPMIVTRGSDQLPVSTKFDMRSDPGVVRNYGKLLLDLAQTVPDGLVCFFVSYSYMDGIVSTWDESGVLQEIMQHKLVFIETQDVMETSLALDNYRKACDCGRGAIFFSIARGKVAEGIDFDRHYGRAVVMFGVPFQYTLSRILRARLEYLRENLQIEEGEFLTFDAIRQASQCMGRVIRSKSDYGMMVLADKRFQRQDKFRKLPEWIRANMPDGNMNLSTDMAIHTARSFLRQMAQPIDHQAAARRTLLSKTDVEGLPTAFAPFAPSSGGLALPAPSSHNNGNSAPVAMVTG
mmetsp:Transcript_10674/g.39175  ORF Transcript_10674/g.39175 Transcript_10674/m.39175 type:complete len:789 (+) Transcript_10674:294-2660(+)